MMEHTQGSFLTRLVQVICPLDVSTATARMNIFNVRPQLTWTRNRWSVRLLGALPKHQRKLVRFTAQMVAAEIDRKTVRSHKHASAHKSRSDV
jgi:hypothetical protein